MNKVLATVCIVGTALLLSACGSSYSYDSGASYANDRTAGHSGAAAEGTSERVFRSTQTK